MVKSPLWEATPGALTALINTGKFVYSNLITISFNSSSDFAPHQITKPTTTNDAIDTEMSWAPDSSNFIYQSQDGIRSVKPDGSSQTLLISRVSMSNDTLASPTYSPDGTKFAFIRYGVPHKTVYTANADGSSPTVIYTDTGDLGIQDLNWGSNNKIIFKINGQDIWSMNGNGSSPGFLFTPPTFAYNLKWSPDATKLLWLGVDLLSPLPYPTAIWTSAADGSSPQQLITFSPFGWVENATWSPDGAKIIFSAAPNYENIISGPGLWMMNSDGSVPHKILSSVGRNGPLEAYDRDQNTPNYACISPDFKWIAWTVVSRLDDGLTGVWIFKIPTPLKLREGLPVAAASDAPVGNIYLTDADVDIALYTGSPVWSSKTVRVDNTNSQLQAHWKRNLDVDKSIIVFAPRVRDDITGAAYPDKVGNTPWIAAAKGGVFSAVDVQVDRAYFPSWGAYQTQKTPTGVLTVFAGRAVEVDCTDTSVIMTLNDYRELFMTMIPPDVFEGQCQWTLFGPGCRLIETSFRSAGTVIAGSSRVRLLTTPVVPLGSGTFLQGKVRMTSGLNQGFVRTVTNWQAPNALSLMNPFPFDIQIGDTFDVFPGCNKTVPTCVLFGNKANHGGFTTIPTATSAL